MFWARVLGYVLACVLLRGCPILIFFFLCVWFFGPPYFFPRKWGGGKAPPPGSAPGGGSHRNMWGKINLQFARMAINSHHIKQEYGEMLDEFIECWC